MIPITSTVMPAAVFAIPAVPMALMTTMVAPAVMAPAVVTVATVMFIPMVVIAVEAEGHKRRHWHGQNHCGKLRAKVVGAVIHVVANLHNARRRRLGAGQKS